jgi:8-oxo-dGTP pyrophosphatase MutT (NUDIX family)
MSGLNHALEAAELAQLATRWGVVPQEHHRLEVDDPFLTGENQLLVSNRRRAEVCYVMHRGDPQAGVLLHIKTFYPTGAYRLPTGGIHQGEGVFDTLIREIDEETGLAVGTGADQVQVQRFLGIVACDFIHRTLGRTFPFATYAFLVQMPVDATLQPRDPAESIGGWQWRRPAELAAVADFLANVGQHTSEWGDWGRYRALIHRFVGQQLGVDG